MQNEQESDTEALAHKKQENLEASLYQFLFVKNFFATPDLASFAQVDKTWKRVVYRGLIDRYAENEGQRRLFTAIKDQSIKELTTVLDEEGHDPNLFEIDGFRTFTFQALVHRWLSYFPKHSGALLLVERIDMTQAERKLCFDVIHTDVANLDPILEAGITLEGDIKLFNPFTYAELMRLERIYSMIKTPQGSFDELKRLLACPIGSFDFLSPGRRVGHALWWARQFQNGAVLQFLNTEYKLIACARSTGDVGRVEFLLATGMQEESRWPSLKNASLATTNFFTNSANTMSQFVRSFWESEDVEKIEESGCRLDSTKN